MKKILLLLLLSSSITFSQSQELTQGLGFAGGMPSGSGFSYRQMHENYGFQVTFGIMVFQEDDFEDYFNESYTGPYAPYDWTQDTSRIFTDESYRDTRKWGNIGITYYRPLHRSNKSLFYGFIGGSTYYTSQTYQTREYKYSMSSDSYDPINKAKEVRENDFTFFAGIGLGIEYRITDNIRIHIEMPITIVDNGNIFMYIPQAGIHYYFK